MTAPVLMIFFNRPDTLQQVFEQVRKNKPKKLYLFQDGQRNDSDRDNILKCRKIVENIDWDCEVFRNYREENYGCGKGPFNAISWLFEHEDEGIILEDDCVPSQSFFSFCSEMLSKYRDDDRVFMITGCNSELKTIGTKESYFFGYAGTNWGWATWRKNWKNVDYSCSWVHDKGLKDNIYHLISNISKTAAKKEVETFEQTNKLVNEGHNISYWDVQFQAVRYLNNQLSIIPSINLITNIGLGATSTHAKTSKIPASLHKKVGKINWCYNERFELDGPINHPKYVVENSKYDKKIYNKLYHISIFGIVKRIIKKLLKMY